MRSVQFRQIAVDSARFKVTVKDFVQPLSQTAARASLGEVGSNFGEIRSVVLIGGRKIAFRSEEPRQFGSTGQKGRALIVPLRARRLAGTKIHACANKGDNLSASQQVHDLS